MEEFCGVVADFLSRGLCSDEEGLEMLDNMLEQMEDFLDEKLSAEFEKIITSKQKRAYFVVRGIIKGVKEGFDKILEFTDEEGNLLDLLEVLKIENKRIRHYLREARKCYAIRSYDATVVMLARAVEYVLKDFLKKNIQFSEKDTLGTLIKLFESNFRDKTSKRILGKIMEVHNFDRIVAAHDVKQDRHIITKDEADHA